MAEINGWHVLGGFGAAFGVIIGVNLLMAYQAVHTFPGLETHNGYVASQTFNKDREAQLALGWDVSADVENGMLHLVILENGKPIAPKIEQAIFGRPTIDNFDQEAEFTFDGSALVAPVEAGPGNWNLRLKARAADGTLFQQRVVVRVEG